MRSPHRPESSGHLGTFAGVFTPSVLTILGIILFLRLGYVVGAAGLWGALAIVLLASTISVLTSFSISAIATNLRVKTGGDYYLISRTLGAGFGGALGLVLFLSQAISIAFYAIGFGEVVGVLVGGPAWIPQVVAGAAVVLLLVLAWLGSDWGTRFQYVVMAVLFASIASFVVGAATLFDTSRLGENLSPASDVPFWLLFAIFFPAVTGFTQGVSMSGDLEGPGAEHPSGDAAGRRSVLRHLPRRDLRLRGRAERLGARDRLHGDAQGLTLRLADGCRSDRRDALLGAGVPHGRAPHPAVPGGGPHLPLPRLLREGRGPDEQPAPRPAPLGWHRSRHGGARRPEPHRAGRVDVLLDLVRPAQLRDVLRGARQEPFVPPALSLVPRSAEPRRCTRLPGRDDRAERLRGGRRRWRPSSACTSTCSAP